MKLLTLCLSICFLCNLCAQRFPGESFWSAGGFDGPPFGGSGTLYNQNGITLSFTIYPAVDSLGNSEKICEWDSTADTHPKYGDGSVLKYWRFKCKLENNSDKLLVFNLTPSLSFELDTDTGIPGAMSSCDIAQASMRPWSDPKVIKPGGSHTVDRPTDGTWFFEAPKIHKWRLGSYKLVDVPDLAAQGKRERYDYYISQADFSLGQGDNQRALQYYKLASELMPSQQYPIERINEIQDSMQSGTLRVTIEDVGESYKDEYDAHPQRHHSDPPYEKYDLSFPLGTFISESVSLKTDENSFVLSGEGSMKSWSVAVAVDDEVTQEGSFDLAWWGNEYQNTGSLYWEETEHISHKWRPIFPEYQHHLEKTDPYKSSLTVTSYDGNKASGFFILHLYNPQARQLTARRGAHIATTGSEEEYIRSRILRVEGEFLDIVNETGDAAINEQMNDFDSLLYDESISIEEKIKALQDSYKNL